MKKTILFGLLLASTCSWAQQATTTIREFRLAGPYAVTTPFVADTVDMNGKKFDEQSLMSGIGLSETAATKVWQAGLLPSLKEQKSVGVLSFYINNSSYLKGQLCVKGPHNYKVFVDGQEAKEELKLAPEHHTVAIKFMAEPSDTDSISVTIKAPATVPYTLEKKHPYMVHDLTDGRRVRGISLSADGAYATVAYQTTERGGQSRWSYELIEVKTNQVLNHLSQNVQWLPRTCAYIEEVWEGSRRMLYQVEPKTGRRTVFVSDLPKGGYTISPTEDYLVLSVEEDGPKEDADVFEVLEMDDRQPGWRKRSHLERYDRATGLTQRITFGNKGEYLCDITQDGTKLLIASSRSRLSKRPTTVTDYLLMDARTLQVDTLLAAAEFLGGASFSPDGKKILFTGNPEGFNRIGCQLP